MPAGVVLGLFPIRVNTLLLLAGTLAFVQVTVPGLPGLGWFVQSQAGPEFWLMDTKVMLLGSVSVRLALVALSGPALVTVIV